MPQITINPARRSVPRGIKTDGWPILSYGFRLFFLGAGVWAFLAMAIWLGHLILGWPIGAEFGAANWHAHELLFGYATAVLAGFMLTAIPNWTGRLPVSGTPLALLFGVWLAGRVALLSSQAIGLLPAMIIDGCFLPLLGFVAAREIGAGQNWRNLHIVLGTGLLTACNIWFHATIAAGGAPQMAYRAAIAIWTALIILIGGRLAVSFTHNWLAKRGVSTLPKSFGKYDRVTVVATVVLLVLWIVWPASRWVAVLLIVAGVLHVVRLSRWKGWLTWREPLVLVLHTSYLFVPIGFFGIAGAAFGWISDVSALHMLTAGAIANMTLAVMTRVTRGHTGRPLSASRATIAAYACLASAAILRPLAEVFAAWYQMLVSLSGLLWFVAFGMFLAEYLPMLVTERKRSSASATAHS